MLSPEHFKQQRKGGTLQHQVPLDIKFSVMYDESIEGEEDSDY